MYDVIKREYAIIFDKYYGKYFRDVHISVVDEFLTNESGIYKKGKTLIKLEIVN